MPRFLFFLLLLLPVFASAQISRRADSAAAQAIRELPEARAKHMAANLTALHDKGINKRLDSIPCTKAVILISSFHGTIMTAEYYYQSPDSAPAFSYRNQRLDTLPFMTDSYSSFAAAAAATTAVSHRENKVVYTCNYGCIRPPRGSIRRNTRYLLKNYSLELLIDKPSGEITTRIVVPPRCPVYFTRRKGHGF